jgi:hypothetical protein
VEREAHSGTYHMGIFIHTSLKGSRTGGVSGKCGKCLAPGHSCPSFYGGHSNFLIMGSQTKYNSPPFPSSPPINVLQPKRLNMTVDPNSPRRILGTKGQLPPVSQLSNQQLTTLLRNSPLLLVDANNCGGGQNEGQQAISSVTKRAPTTMAKRNARERNRVKQVTFFCFS